MSKAMIEAVQVAAALLRRAASEARNQAISIEKAARDTEEKACFDISEKLFELLRGYEFEAKEYSDAANRLEAAHAAEE